jgi:hypothetical protein
MSGTFYKGLGFVVWKAGVWYLRRRYRHKSRRFGAGLVGAFALAVALTAAQRRNGSGN